MSATKAAIFLVPFLFACAEVQAPASGAGGAGAATPHAHPSARAMESAFGRVRSESVRCLTPGVSVTVRGTFTGSTGAFAPDALDAPGASTAAVNCVRASLAGVHVRPFTESSAAFTYTLRADGTVPLPLAPPPPPGAVPPPPPPAAAVPPAPLTGPFPTDQVRAQGEMLRQCFELATSRDHTVEGSVTLRFTLDAAGQVNSCSSHSESPNPDQTLMELVARCIEQHVRTMNFGPQRTPNLEMSVPLSFSPNGPPTP